jgi:putative transcriptional regulator
MKKTTKKVARRSVEDALLHGLRGALAYEKGEKKLTANERDLPGPAPEFSSKEIQTIRQSLFHMSQPQFAILLNVKLPTLRSWEQGKRRPSDSALRLLQLLKEAPQVVKKISHAS